MTLHPHAALLHTFYEAFAARDGAAMGACYAPDAAFSDPVFPDLRGDEIGAMWSMLCRAGKDLEVRVSGITADDTGGRAHWEADYTFATGRKVHNVVEATFTFRDGKIATHVDDFDFRRWSRQAFGPLDLLLGWTPLLRALVRNRAAAGLTRYRAPSRAIPRPSPR